jgi:hypothetical protein
LLGVIAPKQEDPDAVGVFLVARPGLEPGTPRAAWKPLTTAKAALRLLEGVADDVDVLIPGHGSVGAADQVHARIDQDRAYLHA